MLSSLHLLTVVVSSFNVQTGVLHLHKMKFEYETHT